jgi:hypothetical protein
MRLSIGRKVTVLFAGLALLTLAAARVSTAPPALSLSAPQLPNPVLVFMGLEFYEANGKQWTKYNFAVSNREEYPNELFAAAPSLPPCGTNTKASRTWVDIYEQSGKRLYGFCAIGNRDGLGKLGFSLESNVTPPSWIYIEMNDRQTSTKYKSNLTETSL